MVREDLTAFPLVEALQSWAIIVGVLAGISLVLALLAALISTGGAGFNRAVGAILDAFVDVLKTSPGRVWALAMLTFKESARRKALLVFVIFGVLFMFAGWFLTSSDMRPDLQITVYVSFVLTTIGYLIVPLALLLACWGIPEDIRRRSMHTVVTKPVRRSEIVLGRVIGLTGILTLVLLIMGGVGYVWIVRQIPASQQAELVSRVPIYGMINFYNAQNEPVDKGVNVGDVWTYRSYVQGASKAHALFTFEGVTPGVLVDPDGAGGDAEPVLQLESNFEAFRTYKGDMTRGVLVQYTYVNPANPNIRVTDPNPFPIEEFQKNIHNVPQELTAYDVETGQAKTYNLLEDLVAKTATVELPDQYDLTKSSTHSLTNGLQIEVSCLDQGQYLGIAQPDLFIRTPDSPFAVSYFKAIFGLWLMVGLIVTIGVTASCFVKGPVATFLTFALLVVGYFGVEFMQGLLTDYVQGDDGYGGGPIENVVRIFQHMNPTTDFQPSIGVTIMEYIDKAFLGFLWVVSHVIPNLTDYDLAKYPAHGFDIDWSRALLPAVATTFGFLIPCMIIGHLGLRFRELEAK
ncbi:ABC transporter permease [Stratiformator vulcanicus]|uniref:ABC-2 family transporter protein n=1 Tax=Stratiformator vulcanicus TaxID=2527980 RepID=A0A517QZJ8_9PLAN|nr:ABC transporter permease [Stratiformator vulcanicus]QDT37023.1 ABC-2 family transporter protein [Stratiformator vulcanicus]